MNFYRTVASLLCLICLSISLLPAARAEPTVSVSQGARLIIPKGILHVTDRAAPPLRLSDMDGKPFDLSQEKGRWVFVHFWASWCGPCRREIPAIQRMVEKFDSAAFALAIVNTAESDDTVFTFLGMLAPDLVPLLDRDGTVTETWKPRGLPSTYLVDPQGVIRFQALGGRPWDEAEYIDFLSTLTAGR